MTVRAGEEAALASPVLRQAPAPRPLSRRLAGAAPLVLAMAAGALLALVSAYHLLPHGSTNLDELVYLNQAEAIRHGALTYDADTYVPDFRPYLTGVAGDRVVFKYQPLWPAWLALSDAVTGDHRPGLVVAGAAAAAAFWLLGREVTGSRWLGTAMAGAVALSPIVVAHSGTALAYLPAAGLAATTLAAALRGRRTGSAIWLVAAGAALGALFLHRPVDAAIVGVPLGLWLADGARRERRWSPVVAVVLAAVPFAVAWLAVNALTTGDPLTPAFTVDAPSDRFGFGRRASWDAAAPTFVDGAVQYTPKGALLTVAVFAVHSPLWLAGGAVPVALAAVALAGGWRDGRRRLLGATIALVVGTYAFWWGTDNFVRFRLHRSLGPAYWLLAIGPLAALATLGGRDLAVRLRDDPRRHRILLAGIAAAVVSTLAVAVNLVDAMADTRAGRADQLAAADGAPAGSVLLYPTGVDDPFVRVLVPADLEATERLHAVDLQEVAQLFRLHDRFGGRALWGWFQERPAGTMFDPPRSYELRELPVARVTDAVIQARASATGDATVTQAWLRILDDGGEEVRREHRPPGRVLSGRAVPEGSGRDGLVVSRRPAWLAAGVSIDRPGAAPELVEVRWAVRARGAGLDVIGPGRGYRQYEFPERDAWLPEDVSAVLTASVEGVPETPVVRRIERTG